MQYLHSILRLTRGEGACLSYCLSIRNAGLYQFISEMRKNIKSVTSGPSNSFDDYFHHEEQQNNFEKHAMFRICFQNSTKKN